MDTIFLKIKIKKSNSEADEIRKEGLFFLNIADAINVDRDKIEEIDETNYKKIIHQIKRNFQPYDKSRSNKKRKL